MIMATSTTAAEITARLKSAVEASPACQGCRFGITVRRVEDKRRKGKWYADVRPLSGKPDDAEACEEAVKDIIARAQDELELALEG
jgi:hypothetical protein